MTGVICIGECMVELKSRADGAYDQGFAGDAFNVAAYLKRTAPNLEVQFLTATGSDTLSMAMREAWRAEGISDILAFTTPAAIPGLYIINLDRNGERTFTYWRSNSAAKRWFSALVANNSVAALQSAHLIYLSGISLAILSDEERAQALALLNSTRQSGVKVAFDPNYRPALWPSMTEARRWIGETMQIADIVCPSQDDLEALDLVPPPNAETVTTLGAEGCIVATPNQRVKLRTPPAVTVADTSGAGDCFTGVYLATRLNGADPASAAKTALEAATRVVAAPGALVHARISHPPSDENT